MEVKEIKLELKVSFQQVSFTETLPNTWDECNSIEVAVALIPQ